MQKTVIRNINSVIEKNCDILKKNDHTIEVVIEDTTIKITIKKNQIHTLDILKTWSLSQRVSYHALCLRRFYNLH